MREILETENIYIPKENGISKMPEDLPEDNYRLAFVTYNSIVLTEILNKNDLVNKVHEKERKFPKTKIFYSKYKPSEEYKTDLNHPQVQEA